MSSFGVFTACSAIWKGLSIMWLMMIKLIMQITANELERKAVALLVSLLTICLKTERKDPLAPKTSKDILMTMNAKWYNMVTENIRLSDISTSNVDKETRKTPMYRGNIFVFFMARSDYALSQCENSWEIMSLFRFCREKSTPKVARLETTLHPGKTASGIEQAKTGPPAGEGDTTMGEVIVWGRDLHFIDDEHFKNLTKQGPCTALLALKVLFG
jgi:hypothetical protein